MRVLSLDSEPFHLLPYRSSGPGGRARSCVLPFLRGRVSQLPEGVSAVVATADLQGRELDESNRLLGEAVAEELALLAELEEIASPFGTLLAGDLYDRADLGKLGATGDVCSVWEAFAAVSEWTVGVQGNHDLFPGEASFPDSAHLLDGTTVDLASLRIGGVGGIIGRRGRNARRTQEDFVAALQKMWRRRPQVVLLHQGPDHPDTQQRGDPGVRAVIERMAPSLVIFGHCHWKIPLVTLRNSQALNVDARVVVLTE